MNNRVNKSRIQIRFYSGLNMRRKINLKNRAKMKEQDALVKQLILQVKKHEKGHPLVWLGAILFEVLLVTGLILSIFSRSFTQFMSWGMFFAAAFSLIIPCIVCSHIVNKHLRRIYDNLPPTDEQALRVLFELLNRVSNLQFKKEIRTKIVLLLPHMQRSQLLRLNSKHWKLLYENLFDASEEHVLSVLHAVEQVEEVGALPSVMLLTYGYGAAKYSNVVRERAQDCEQILDARMHCNDTSQTLLRPSVATSPNMLLRPASGTAQATPEETAQLLRPTLGQEQEDAAPTNQPALSLTEQAVPEEAEQRLRLGSEPEE